MVLGQVALLSYRMRLSTPGEVISLVRAEASGVIKVRVAVALMLMFVSSALFSSGTFIVATIVDVRPVRYVDLS